MFLLGDFRLPMSGGRASLALRLLTGDESSGLTGDEKVTTFELLGSDTGALVA
jgi:hypothetical protein